MQVLASTRAKAGRPSRFAFYTALFAGTIFTATGVALLYIVFGGAFMTRFMPTGRPSTYELVIGALAWTFRANRRLFARTVPLPLSIVLDSLPDVGPVSKEIDVSFRGRASHPRRPMAVQILSRMRGVNFAGDVYAGPEDRKYKLKAGVLARFRAKVFDNTFAGGADQRKYRSPEDYYREIAASKIAVALRGGAETPTFRYFEIAAFRTMLISDPPETVIPNDFVDRQHAVYCKRDLSDLEKLVRHYLHEDAEREAIANAGYEHLVKYHTCERRAEYFLETCRRLV